MLPSKYRFAGDEVKEVFDKGARVANQYGSVIFLKHKEFKAAVVVSKKIAGSAVVRNKIRRRIYALFETMRPSIYSTHLVILPNKAVLDFKGEQLIAAVKTLLEKAHLLVS